MSYISLQEGNKPLYKNVKISLQIMLDLIFLWLANPTEFGGGFPQTPNQSGPWIKWHTLKAHSEALFSVLFWGKINFKEF